MNAKVFKSLITALLLCLALTPTTLFAQGTDLGTIRGTVSDSAGAVIPGATVVITDLTTGASRTATTNGSGAYEVFGLKSGAYTLRVTAQGFEKKDIAGVVINTSAAANVSVVLGVASKSETVEVTAEAAAINTEDQTISQSLSNQAVIGLPRDSRDVFQFAYLNPNITQSTDVGTFKFIGSQSYGANFTIDGQRSNGGIWGEQTKSQPSLEAVGDISVMSNDFSAEYAGISNVRVTTKRGGASMHGTLFWDNRNSAFAAWTRQDKNGAATFAPSAFQSKYPTPYFNTNIFGGSFSGPVPHLKNTWFFAAYEKNYSVQPVNVYSGTLPHPTLLAGNFSQVNDSIKPAVPADILSQMTPAEIANNTVGGLGLQFITIPQRFLNPDAQLLVSKYFPHIGTSAPINATTGWVPGYQTQLSGKGITDTGTLRLDHNFGDRDALFVVYNTAANTNASNLVQKPYTGLGLSQTERRNHTISVSYTKTISDTLINEVRGGFNKQHLYTHSNQTLSEFLSSIGFTKDQIASYGSAVGPAELSTYGHMAINFNGKFATLDNGARNTDRPMDQNLATFGDTLTWSRGKHGFRFGADSVRNQAVDGFAVNRGYVRGLLTYGGSGATPLSNFLLGEPAKTVTYVQTPRPPMSVHNWEYGFFLQDNWRLNSKLTLNLGLRYEISTPFTESEGVMVNFDPYYFNTETSQWGRFIIPNDGAMAYLPPFVKNYGTVVASQSGLGVGEGLIRQSWDKVAPRIGLAWRISDKTVLRGGWGLYYPTSAAQGIRDPLSTNSFNQKLTASNLAGVPVSPWPTPTSGSSSPINGGSVPAWMNTGQYSVSAVDVGLKDPRIHQYNISLERELPGKNSIRASYLGSYMQRLIAKQELEIFPPSDNPVGTSTGDGVTPCDPTNWDCSYSPAELARMRFPNISDGIPIWKNTGHGRSDAFQVEFNHRPAKGLMLSASYTYLNQMSNPADSGNSSLGTSEYNFLAPGSDYAVDSWVSHHRFVAFGTYALPFGRGRGFGSSMPKWLDAIVGGWESSFNMFAKTGTYFTPFWACNNCGPVYPGNLGSSDVDATGDYQGWQSYRANVLSNNIYTNNGSVIWNSAAFGLPSLGADLFTNPAVAKRNMLLGPGAWGVNLGVNKEFKIGERVAAKFGVDIDNLFNHRLLMPTINDAGGGGTMAQVGDFDIGVDPATMKPTIANVNVNPDFGKLINGNNQEGVDSRRTMRFRLRITF